MNRLFILIFLLFTSALYGKDIEKIFQVYEFFSKTEYKAVADIIVAQGALESAWYKNKWHVLKSNYFSILNNKKENCQDNQVECMHTYTSVEDSCRALLNILRKKKYRTDRLGYLEDLDAGPGGNKKFRYAKDPLYVVKLNKILRVLWNGILNKEEYTWRSGETSTKMFKENI